MHFDFSLYTTSIYHYGIYQGLLTSQGVIGIHNPLIFIVFGHSNIRGRLGKQKQAAQKNPTTSLGLPNLEGQNWQKLIVFSFIFLDAHQ